MKTIALLATIALAAILIPALPASAQAPATPAPATFVAPVTPPHIIAVPFTMTAPQFALWLGSVPSGQTLQSVFAAAAPVQSALQPGQTLVAVKSVNVSDIDQATVNITVRVQITP